MDSPHRRRAEAVAVRNGRIAAIGGDRDLRHLCGRRTAVMDAQGGTILPGINDSHVHLASWGLTFPPLSVEVAAPTIAALVAKVAAAAAAIPSGSWIRGRGWSEIDLPRAPTRHDLDPVCGDRPAVLVDFTLHACVANTRALQLAGIGRDTIAPGGGVIERDEHGEPTGVLREGAQDLLQAVVPAYTRAELTQAITTAAAVLTAQGVTSITDPGITPDLARLYRDLTDAGSLPLRVTALLHAGDSPDTMREAIAASWPLQGDNPRSFRVAGVKIFGDGVPTAARTAWLHEPYTDGTNGALTIAGTTEAAQVANLRAMIAMAHRAGLQIGTHATGDATVDAVVAAYLAAMRHDRRRDPRHYVIHGDLAPAQTLRTMARHDIGVNMNSQIKWLIDRALEPLLGPQRTDYHWPYRTAVDAGVRVSTGSDGPVTTPDWRIGVMQMVLRKGSLGSVSGPDQRLTLQEALQTYTSTPAWQDRADTWKGTLAPGQAADLVVLDASIEDIAPGDIPAVGVRATVADGLVVHDPHNTARTATPQRRPAWTDAHGRACYTSGTCCCTLSRALLHGRA
ncbi:amidohydrolase [Catellatospora sp. NPDC049133]|uniref:amidohydrolase n=1 Tax=Catellatospora sp. NPDC049133 TaxID=3155499 RepID=UPI0033DF8D4B